MMNDALCDQIRRRFTELRIPRPCDMDPEIMEYLRVWIKGGVILVVTDTDDGRLKIRIEPANPKPEIEPGQEGRP